MSRGDVLVDRERRALEAAASRELQHSAEQYRAARAGREPAEALPQYLRWQLIRELHGEGMSDRAIAAWTCTSLYTTARIRDGLGLEPNASPAVELERSWPDRLPLERRGRQARLDAQLQEAAAQFAATARRTLRRAATPQTPERRAQAPIPGERRATRPALPNRKDDVA